MILRSLLSALIPTAHAVNLDQIGSEDPSIAAMWSIIRGIFPYTSVGGAGSQLLLLKVPAFVLTLVAGVAVLVLLYAGIRLIISQGEESSYGEAKKMATYAGIGLVCAVFADVIVLYVMYLVEAAVSGT